MMPPTESETVEVGAACRVLDVDGSRGFKAARLVRRRSSDSAAVPALTSAASDLPASGETALRDQLAVGVALPGPHSLSGKKSDAGDALVLAHILRTDLPAHRPLPADSDLAQAITVLARAQQDAVWDRQQFGNRLRSLAAGLLPGRGRRVLRPVPSG